MRRFKMVLLVATTGWLLAWTGPLQVTTDTGDDINPSVCKEWLEDTLTCMVWQSNRNGNWDIYARFCAAGPGNGWPSELPVSTDSLEEMHPAVACRSDYSGEDWFWCCWQRRETDWFGAIWASFSRGDAWDRLVRIGRLSPRRGRGFVQAQPGHHPGHDVGGLGQSRHLRVLHQLFLSRRQLVV